MAPFRASKPPANRLQARLIAADRRRPFLTQPALPWAPRPLTIGAELEVDIEGGWISAEVAESHGDHQYTLLVHPVDEDDALPAQAQEGDLAAGAAAAAAGSGEADAPGGSAGGPAAADEDGAEGTEVLEMRIRIVSDSLLDVLDSDGGEEGGSMRCHWRPAATSIQEMFSRAFLNLAQRQPLPKGVELPSADQLAAVMAQASGAAGQCEEAGAVVGSARHELLIAGTLPW